jgi:hypothetical protein
MLYTSALLLSDLQSIFVKLDLVKIFTYSELVNILNDNPSFQYIYVIGLHCLINLKLFFPPQLSLSATSFFSVFSTYLDPIPYIV